MNKPDCLLGIDLGTSSVKLLLKYRDGRTVKAREIPRESLRQANGS